MTDDLAASVPDGVGRNDDKQRVIPAYLGWGNPERATVSLRLYATDDDDSPRWDTRFQGGRVVEYAAVERGSSEGDRYLIVRVGNRFTPDEVMHGVAAVIEEALRAD